MMTGEFLWMFESSIILYRLIVFYFVFVFKIYLTVRLMLFVAKMLGLGFCNLGTVFTDMSTLDRLSAFHLGTILQQ